MFPKEIWYEILKYIDFDTARSIQHVSQFFKNYIERKYNIFSIKIKNNKINGYERGRSWEGNCWRIGINFNITITLDSILFVIAICDSYGWDSEILIKKSVGKQIVADDGRYDAKEYGTLKEAILDINHARRFQDIMFMKIMLKVLYKLLKKYYDIFEQIEGLYISTKLKKLDEEAELNKFELDIPYHWHGFPDHW